MAADTTHSAQERAGRPFPVSWDQFHRDCRALTWRLNEVGPFHAVIAITRGGLVPAAIVALRWVCQIGSRGAGTLRVGRRVVATRSIRSASDISCAAMTLTNPYGGALIDLGAAPRLVHVGKGGLGVRFAESSGQILLAADKESFRATPLGGPAEEDLWEQHAGWWQEGFTDGADPEYEEQILPLAAEWLRGTHRVLDVGTGEGQIARLAVKNGAGLVLGVDPTWGQLTVARERASRSRRASTFPIS